MPTEREQQILDLIRQNPMITQKELAHRLGITRPGVASHISRLIKEGLVVVSPLLISLVWKQRS